VTGLATNSILALCAHTRSAHKGCHAVIYFLSLADGVHTHLSSSSPNSLCFQLLFSAFLYPPGAGPNTAKMPNSTSYFISPDPMTPADDPSIIAFFALQIIGGNVLIPIMVLASFVRGNTYSRSPIFMNFCVSWIAYSISFMLS